MAAGPRSSPRAFLVAAAVAAAAAGLLAGWLAGDGAASAAYGLAIGILVAAALPLATRLVPALRVPPQAEAPDEDAEEAASETEDAASRGLLESVLRFPEVEVRRVMSPRPSVVGVSVQWSADEVLRFAAENKFSRYPVYDASPNDVIGFLYYKDLIDILYQKKDFDLRKLLRPPFFVPETMTLATLLKEMQRRRTEMAVVVNEHGNVEGLVTLEDVLEEIVGPIQDEYDVEERRVERLRDGSWLVDASLLVDDLPPDLKPLVPSEEGYETVAGFALATLQHLPKSGETWDTRGWRMTVVEMDGRRIARLKVQKL